MGQTTGERILKGAAIVSVCIMLAKLMGFVQKVVMAKEFGTGIPADAYAFAFGSIVASFIMTPQKLITPFLPLFVEERQKNGERAAWSFASTVMILLVGVTLVAAVGGVLGARPIVRLISKFESAEAQDLSVTLLRIMLPAGVFAAFFALGALLLNSQKRFGLPAFGDVLNKLLVVVVMVLLSRSMGISGLAMGVVLGAVAGVMLIGFGLRREILNFRLRLDLTSPPFRKLLWLMLPVLAGLLVAQARNMIDYWFASGMGKGYASSLSYARTLADTIVLLVAQAVGIVAYPYFSDMATSGKKDEAQRALMGMLRMMAFVFVPLSVAAITLRYPLIQAVFQRDQFTAESVELTIGPFMFYTAGLAAFGVEIILMQFYLSMKNTMTPFVVGVGCVLVHLGIVWFLHESMKHSSLALAFSLSRTIKAIILYFLLKGRLPSICLRQNLVFGAKTLLATVVMAAAMYWMFAGAEALFPMRAGIGGVQRLVLLGGKMGCCGLVGFVCFGLISHWLGMSETRMILNYCRQRVGRGRQNPNS